MVIIHGIKTYILPFSAVISIVALLHGFPFPAQNEFVYLTIPGILYENGLYLNDWLFRDKWMSHFIFDLFAGAAIRFSSIETVAAIGRTVCWICIAGLLFRLGALLKISAWPTALAVIFWLIQGQALVGGAWMIGGFEAKCISYILLLWALIRHIRKKETSASVLLGLSFCFHPSVGAFAILAYGMTLVAMGTPFKKILRIVLITFAGALPGIICLLPILAGDTSLSYQDSRFLCLVRMPHHLDPFSWSKRIQLAQALMFAFNCQFIYINRDHRPARFLFIFQACLGLFFVAGIVLRYLECFSFLIYFPFRLFPMFLLLIFFLFIVHTCCNLDRRHRTLITLGLVTAMCLGNPFGRIVDKTEAVRKTWRAEKDEIAEAFRWIQENTPPDAVILAPTWRKDAWYRTRRAQVINSTVFPYDHRIAEYRKRLSLIYGQFTSMKTAADMEAIYRELTAPDIRHLARTYGADYFVGHPGYPFAVCHKSGTYWIYSFR